MNRKVVVSLFDRSGIMVEPWLKAGYECYCYDIANKDEDEGALHIRQADLRYGPPQPEFGYDEIAFVAAFPPCDHLAISGARWFKGKGLRKLADGIECFATAAEYCEASGAPYLIENPVSTIATYWRKPDHSFHPWYYSNLHGYDHYHKKTCLWTGGGFIMPPQDTNHILGEPSDHMHFTGQSKSRTMEKSLTPPGFALAVFNANSIGR